MSPIAPVQGLRDGPLPLIKLREQDVSASELYPGPLASARRPSATSPRRRRCWRIGIAVGICVALRLSSAPTLVELARPPARQAGPIVAGLPRRRAPSPCVPPRRAALLPAPDAGLAGASSTARRRRARGDHHRAAPPSTPTVRQPPPATSARRPRPARAGRIAEPARRCRPPALPGRRPSIELLRDSITLRASALALPMPRPRRSPRPGPARSRSGAGSGPNVVGLGLDQGRRSPSLSGGPGSPPTSPPPRSTSSSSHRANGSSSSQTPPGRVVKTLNQATQVFDELRVPRDVPQSTSEKLRRPVSPGYSGSGVPGSAEAVRPADLTARAPSLCILQADGSHPEHDRGPTHGRKRRCAGPPGCRVVGRTTLGRRGQIDRLTHTSTGTTNSQIAAELSTPRATTPWRADDEVPIYRLDCINLI